MGGAIERFLVRHRTTAALLFAYWSFFRRICLDVDHLSDAGSEVLYTELLAGTTFLDAGAEGSLTRSSVLAHKRKLKGNSTKKKLGLRREVSKKRAKSNADELSQNDDVVSLLESTLRIAAGESEPLRRAHLLKESYAALARIHSARGNYHEMLHAMSLALHASQDASDTEGACNLHIELGHLELKHHRYYAASTRFKDALHMGRLNETRTEALAGLGWATLAQGGLDVARGQFLQALGWVTSSFAPQPAATDVVAKHGCRANSDGLDGARILALAGLSLINTRTSSLGGPSEILADCAAFILQGLSADLQEPLIWSALGLARHALSNTAAAKRYHHRAFLRERTDPALVASQHKKDEVPACEAAADLSSCSHTALHLGLVAFDAGNSSIGARHVESLLSRVGDISVEAAEWLTRFARSHSWAPSGREFGAFLLSHVEPLLRSEDGTRLAQHFVDYGRFLLAHRDDTAKIRDGLAQLSRAQAIIEKADTRWPDAESASFYSTMGAVQHQVGEIEEAIRSFERALMYDNKAAADGNPNYKRMLLSHANLGAARLELAGADPHRWRVALEDLRAGRHVAHEAGLSLMDPVMKQFETSFRNAMRLATHRGMLQSCPGPLDALLYGLSCSRDADVVP